MKTKIKVDILAKSNIASLMQYEKKPVNGPSKLLASMLTHFLTASGQKTALAFCLEYFTDLCLKEILQLQDCNYKS